MEKLETQEMHCGVDLILQSYIMIEVLSIKSTTLPLADEEEQRKSVDETEKKSDLSRVTSKTFKTGRFSESDEIQILRNRLFARLSSYGDVVHIYFKNFKFAKNWP